LTGNQIGMLSDAGYFSTPVENPHIYPAFATATNNSVSLEYRVRSYLAVNCVQCHQPGGVGASTWNARPDVTLEETGLINGLPDNNGANPLNKLIVPGDTNHSVVWLRLKGQGFSRMPPLATHQLDEAAINLLATWISTDLTNRQTFADWQLAHFGSTSAPSAAPDFDADGDGANNQIEFLTQTDPQEISDVWKLSVSTDNGEVNLSYPRVANLGVVIETSPDLVQWTAWEASGNQPFFSATPGTTQLNSLMSTNPPHQYFRAKFLAP
jgi:mono/diheme cytochrome c family protein